MTLIAVEEVTTPLLSIDATTVSCEPVFTAVGSA